MDYRLLEVIACPNCKGKLYYDKKKQELVCKYGHIAYPIENGIPILLPERARKIKIDEVP